ncbi:MAG: glycosyltransferase family 39 protein, partial [Anaerolineae bacterium]|nr:glycosyltransferase family 39 protein [Anaerolineae bacterium]
MSKITVMLLLWAGFALRLYRLGAESLWYDETVSAFLASLPPLDLIGHTARDIHPPGYYLLLHFWRGLAGSSEFALAFFSLSFSLLLIAATGRLARHLTGSRAVANWAMLLVALSPYQVWYAQEVRMYTLAAFLGLAASLCFLIARPKSGQARLLYWLGYVLCATAGLYTLYYFAFLLIALNVFWLIETLRPKVNREQLSTFLGLNLVVLLLYLPWLPIAWRQATDPPVPPWRTPQSPGAIWLESWSALSLGQSIEPGHLWPVLGLTLLLFFLGLSRLKHHLALFLALYTFGPLLLIQLFSLMTPLYHVRYLFTYAPAFYILLAAGITKMATRINIGVTLTATAILLGANAFSLYQLHTDARYQADDLRGAVQFIETQWQPGDVILTNAGYTYPAFVIYTTWPDLERHRLVPYQPPTKFDQPMLLQGGTVAGTPRLGWGDPRSDFYAMSATETIAALEALAGDYQRLWLLRAYDTVTDPTGLIRTWLAEQTIPLEDQLFAGQSNIRAQGFLLPKPVPLNGEAVDFADGMRLVGWTLPQQTWQAGQVVPVKLGWQTTSRP